jgi:hypothetical protein
MDGMHSGSPNRKLLGGLALLIGLGVVIVALGSGTNLLAFLPFLFILACPLMMFFMMGSMGHDRMGHDRMGHDHMVGSEGQQGGASDDLPDLAGLPRDQQIWNLRHELTRMAWRQEALRQNLEQLEAEQKAERVVGTENTAGIR